jgi:uncharacterized protein YneF (UPF0154 family)
MIPWWVIVIGIIVIVTVFMTVRGWIAARRCRRMLKKGNDITPTNFDEDSESGS